MLWEAVEPSRSEPFLEEVGHLCWCYVTLLGRHGKKCQLTPYTEPTTDLRNNITKGPRRPLQGDHHTGRTQGKRSWVRSPWGGYTKKGWECGSMFVSSRRREAFSLLAGSHSGVTKETGLGESQDRVHTMHLCDEAVHSIQVRGSKKYKGLG